MSSGDLIKFLGTAGARYVVSRQLRYSAGTLIRLGGQNIVLDPGPGTLVRLAKSKPAIAVTTLDAIILSHGHIDHSNDVNVLIDGMTDGGFKRRGRLFAPGDCLEGENSVVFHYLRGFLDEIVTLKAQSDYRQGDIRVSTSAPHDHGTETYGIILDHRGTKISFMVDTRFFPELLASYECSAILVINLVRDRPHESGDVRHLCVDDAREILKAIRPRKAVLTHFGMTMIRAKPWVVAQQLSDELGVDVTAASDGMTLELH